MYANVDQIYLKVRVMVYFKSDECIVFKILSVNLKQKDLLVNIMNY